MQQLPSKCRKEPMLLRARNRGWVESYKRIRRLRACSPTALTDPSSVVKYLQNAKPASPLLQCASILEAKELTDGKLNHVFLVTCRDGKRSRQVIVKHAPPYAKCLGETMPLSQERLRVEFEAMMQLQSHAPDHVPMIYHYDAYQSVMIMQYLPAPHEKVMLGMHKLGLCYPQLAHHVSTLLSASLFFTSAHALSPESMAANTHRYANSLIVEANERVVLTEPLDPHCSANRQLLPAVQPHADALRCDAKVLQALEECVHSYRTKKEALLHNDLHTGNLLATATSTYCIDWEFATVGPMGFDLGCLLGVLILAYIVLRHQPDSSNSPHTGSPYTSSEGPPAGPASMGSGAGDLPWTRSGEGDQGSGVMGSPEDCLSERSSEESGKWCARAQQCGWLLGAIRELWSQLCWKFQLHEEEIARQVARGELGSHFFSSWGAVSPSSCSVWVDTLGFAAFCMMRLTIGMHAYPGYQFVHGQGPRSSAEITALQVARELLELRDAAKAASIAASSPRGLEEVISIMQKVAWT